MIVERLARGRLLRPGLIAFGLLLVLLAFMPTLLPIFYTRLVTEMLVWAIFAMSLDLLLGYTGMPSLGHAAYFGMAAYSVALLNVHWHYGAFVPNVLVGVAVAGGVALVFGVLILRTSNVGFLLITLALAQVLWGLAFRWASFTGGDNGLTGIVPPKLFGYSFDTPDSYYYLALAITTVAAVLIYLVSISSFGRSLVGIRESPSRMAALGYNVWLHKYVVVIIAGLFAGLAGTLAAYLQEFVAPSFLEIQTSVQVLLMAILGGAGTLVGSALGAAAVILLRDRVSDYTERWVMVMGIVYVVVMLVARRGIVGEIKYRVRTPGRHWRALIPGLRPAGQVVAGGGAHNEEDETAR